MQRKYLTENINRCVSFHYKLSLLLKVVLIKFIFIYFMSGPLSQFSYFFKSGKHLLHRLPVNSSKLLFQPFI